MLLRLLHLRALWLSKTLWHVLTSNWSRGTRLLPIWLVRDICSINSNDWMASLGISLNNSTVVVTVVLLVTYKNVGTCGNIIWGLHLVAWLWEVVNLSILRKCLIFVEALLVWRLHVALRWNFPIQRLSWIVVLICIHANNLIRILDLFHLHSSRLHVVCSSISVLDLTFSVTFW